MNQQMGKNIDFTRMSSSVDGKQIFSFFKDSSSVLYETGGENFVARIKFIPIKMLVIRKWKYFCLKKNCTLF